MYRAIIVMCFTQYRAISQPSHLTGQYYSNYNYKQNQLNLTIRVNTLFKQLHHFSRQLLEFRKKYFLAIVS